MDDRGRRKSFGRPSFVVRPPKRVHAEQPVGPDVHRRPAGALRERLKTLDRVLITVLGMDGLAEAETDRLAIHADLLSLQAGEVHLDAIAGAVVARMVLERGQIEIAAELAVDAGEQVEIKFGGHAFGGSIAPRSTLSAGESAPVVDVAAGTAID